MVWESELLFRVKVRGKSIKITSVLFFSIVLLFFPLGCVFLMLLFLHCSFCVVFLHWWWCSFHIGVIAFPCWCYRLHVGVVAYVMMVLLFMLRLCCCSCHVGAIAFHMLVLLFVSCWCCYLFTLVLLHSPVGVIAFLHWCYYLPFLVLLASHVNDPTLSTLVLLPILC